MAKIKSPKEKRIALTYKQQVVLDYIRKHPEEDHDQIKNGIHEYNPDFFMFNALTALTCKDLIFQTRRGYETTIRGQTIKLPDLEHDNTESDNTKQATLDDAF